MKYTGKRKFQATERQMVQLFVDRCKKYGVSKSGTYNNADPTHYEKVRVTFLTYDKDGSLTVPLDIALDDSTWFITITFSENENKLALGMWDPQNGCFINVTLDGEAFFDLLHKALFEAEHASEHESEQKLADHLDAMGYNEI